MSEDFLDRDQVESAEVELGRAVVPQDVRGELVAPARQMCCGRSLDAAAQGIVADPARGAVGASAFGGEQRGAGAGVVVVELAPDVLDEPSKRAVGAVDQRDHPLARARAPGALAVADVELAEAAQLPLDVRQIELASLADPQPDLGHQLGSGVVPGGRGELPAGRQLAAPSGEQRLDLRPGRRNPQCRVLRAARPVHLVDRALDHPTGHPVDLDLVPQLQEQEVRGQRLRAPQPGAARRSPQHLPEVGVGVRRLHLPKRPAEPGPHLLQVPDVPADRSVRQPRRGPRQHEPGQHVGLELLQFLRRGRGPDVAQVPYGSQCQPEPPHLHPDRELIGHGENASGIPKLRQPANCCGREGEPPGHDVEESRRLRAIHGMSHRTAP